LKASELDFELPQKLPTSSGGLRRDSMKDSEVRGLVLKSLYDARHGNRGGHVNIPSELGVPGFDLQKNDDIRVLGNVTKQLADQGLVKFHEVVSTSYPSGLAQITASGVDVVEGDPPPIPIVFPVVYAHHVDQSVTVHGSYNQVGKGNVQNFGTIEKLTLAVEQSQVTPQEKEEAKSLLTKLGENKLVMALLAKFGLDLS
jgi:hypothetical protein